MAIKEKTYTEEEAKKKCTSFYYSKGKTIYYDNYGNEMKIVEKKEGSTLKEEQAKFNERLKEKAYQRLKRELYRELVQNNESSLVDGIDTYKNIKGKVNTAKRFARILTSHLGKYLIGIVGVFLLVILATSVVTAVAGVFMDEPKIDMEAQTKLVEMMNQLDKSCSQKLDEDFQVIGSVDTDWKAALSLYMGYHNNDLVGKEKSSYEKIIEEAAEKYGLDKWLICGVIMTESSWINHPPNQYTASGFMQVTEVCAADMGYDHELVKTDVYTNIMCGSGYLKKMIDSCRGDVTLGLAAYNSGLGNVQRYGWSVPPYKETQDYVVKVRSYENMYRSGSMVVPNGEAESNGVGNESELTRIYNVINEVVDSKTLKRRSFEEALEILGYNADQKFQAELLYELDEWNIREDYKFNITGDSQGVIDWTEFINGTRPGGEIIINYAMKELGNQGGKKYWSWYGFNSRVAWCAIWVHWVMNTEPSGAGKSYPTNAQTTNNAYCPTLVNWFKKNNRWGNRDFENLTSGDIIFFDWDNDSTSDHVGLYIGRDENYIYTIEGNSGDMVRTKQYQIGSKSIQGYGLMQY